MTTARITLDHLGPAATIADLCAYSDEIKSVCIADNAIEDFSIRWDGQGFTLKIYSATTTADAIAEAVYNEGAWAQP